MLDNCRVVHHTHITTKGVLTCCYTDCKLLCTCCGDDPAVLDPRNVIGGWVAATSHTGQSGVLILMKCLFV